MEVILNVTVITTEVSLKYVHTDERSFYPPLVVCCDLFHSLADHLHTDDEI